MSRTYCAMFLCLFLAESLAAQDRTSSFVYRKTKEANLALHVHYPPGWRESDRRPAMVFFFGGGWTGGKIEQFLPQAQYFASRGLVTLRADYRVKSRHGVTPEQCVDDARQAVRWIRQNAGRLGIDPTKIVSSGGSAGGHLAACTYFTEGPADEGASVTAKPNALILYNPVLKFSGVAKLQERLTDVSLAKSISPTLLLAKGAPPTLLFFGSVDPLLSQGEEFLSRAKEFGVQVEMMTAEGQGHGYFNRSPWLEKTTRRADEFLVSLGYLKGEAKVPDSLK